MKFKKRDTLVKELKRHLPFTLVASLAAGILVAIFFLFDLFSVDFVLGTFDILHPAHVLVSAAATAAIFYKYERSIFESILIGIVGAILIGSLSDVLLPWISGNLFFLETHFHLPLVEEPLMIFSVALIGSVIGVSTRLFRVPHTLHVFLSVFASLFYLLAFSNVVNVGVILLISAIVFLAVFIPCCISDIVFPLLFIRKPCKDCGHWHE